MLRQQESMQVEMAKALQTPLAPFAEMARKNMELWEQMQAATLDALMGRAPAAPNAADSSNAANGQKSTPQTDHKKEK
jgi:hypothetical protein